MPMQWYELVAMACFAFAVSAGSVLDWFHEWASGFTKPSNVFRILSDGLGCPMCFGFWVGFAWSAGRLPWPMVFVCGGLVSGLAMAIGEVVSFARDVRDRITLPVKTTKAQAARAMMNARAEQDAHAKALARHRVEIGPEGQLSGADSAFNVVAARAEQADPELADDD